MNDLDRARLKRMLQPGAAGLLAFVQYVYPSVFPSERFERTPVVDAIAAVVAAGQDH